MCLAAIAAAMEIPVPQKTISPSLISLAATNTIISPNEYSGTAPLPPVQARPISQLRVSSYL